MSDLRTYYHGTSLANWEKIKTEGLVPNGGKGGDYWATYSRSAVFQRLFGGVPDKRPDSVYLAKDKINAMAFAAYSAEVNNSTPVLIRVSLDPSQLIRDEEADQWGFRCECVIPPAQLERIYTSHVPH